MATVANLYLQIFYRIISVLKYDFQTANWSRIPARIPSGSVYDLGRVAVMNVIIEARSGTESLR